MLDLPFPTRRQVLAGAAAAALSASLAPRLAQARPPRPLRVLITLPGGERLASRLTAAGLPSARLAIDDLLDRPGALDALAGVRLLLVGSPADQVLAELALDDCRPDARRRGRSQHVARPDRVLHTLETSADQPPAPCIRAIARDHLAAGRACELRGDAPLRRPGRPPQGAEWQADTLARLIEAEGGPALPLTWPEAPAAFATLTADL